MNTKNLPAKLLAILGILFALGVIIPAMCSNTPMLDPVRYAEADATRTAQAPEILVTEQYIDRVLPTQQAVEASEIEETTRDWYEWERSIDQVNALATMAQRIAFAVGASLLFVGVGVGIGGWSGARGVREMKRAALPQTQHLLEGPHITKYGTVTHTATGGTWQIDAPSDALPDHARIVGATYEAMPRGVLVELLEAQRALNGNVKRLT